MDHCLRDALKRAFRRSGDNTLDNAAVSSDYSSVRIDDGGILAGGDIPGQPILSRAGQVLRRTSDGRDASATHYR